MLRPLVLLIAICASLRLKPAKNVSNTLKVNGIGIVFCEHILTEAWAHPGLHAVDRLKTSCADHHGNARTDCEALAARAARAKLGALPKSKWARKQVCAQLVAARADPPIEEPDMVTLLLILVVLCGFGLLCICCVLGEHEQADHKSHQEQLWGAPPVSDTVIDPAAHPPIMVRSGGPARPHSDAGTLVLCIKQGRGIVHSGSADIHMTVSGSGGRIDKRTSSASGMEPVWNSFCYFPILSVEDMPMCEIFVRDAASEKAVGVYRLDIRELPDNVILEKTVELKAPPQAGRSYRSARAVGSLTFTAEFQTMEAGR
mmetsp:Transcript_69010/g.183895  ORF Transcript_69010/g.183895 Transcript_69010/m.183895 type:complete len:315 (-) Transcript_69010:80-1024(-)